MSDEAYRNRQRKCICRMPDVDQWRVIRESGDSCVVLCTACKQVWHTSAQYGKELEREIVSSYAWKLIRQSAGYHGREEEEPYDFTDAPEA